MCSVIMIVAFTFINGETGYDYRAMKDRAQVNQVESNWPALAPMLLEQGVVDIKLHDTIDIKPIPGCE